MYFVLGGAFYTKTRGKGQGQLVWTRAHWEVSLYRKETEIFREHTLIFVAPLTDFSKELDMVPRSARSEAEVEEGFAFSGSRGTAYRTGRMKQERRVVGL